MNAGIKWPRCLIEDVGKCRTMSCARKYNKLNGFVIIPTSAGLAVLGDKVYAVGGFNGSLRVRTVDVYDPASDSWSTCNSMEARRSTLGVAVLNGCIYAVGGFDGSTGLSSAEMFDPKTQEWRMIASMSTRRSSVGVSALIEFLPLIVFISH